MKYQIFILIFFTSFLTFSQNITVDSQTYTAQQLIENVLINSTCISNVVVTNVIGGNFNSTDKSYGYFNALGTNFPFDEGLVLSTGKLVNVPGPNTSISDDDAINWIGDSDLETVLNESNTTNATIIEFDFVSLTNQVSFNYIFASEEYQENNSNTCSYSDLFGFLIRPKNSANYTNIALVPNTQTPVKVTTVHPTIPGGCTAQNEAYFGSWNGATAPINFNGQTKVLTAKANVIPNEIYHVKLVIADEKNYRYDSAVFMEAGSFNQSTNLGVDRLFSTNNPVCESETVELNAESLGTGATYKWFKNGVEIPSEINSNYTVVDSGFYEVEVTLASGCISYGEITIEYTAVLKTNPNYLNLSELDQDGLSFFNLHLADPFYKVDMTGLTVVDFYLEEKEAIQNGDAIDDPYVFFNTEVNQKVYARIENEYGCFSVESLTLDTNYNPLSFTTFEACDETNNGIATFDLNELRTQIRPEVSSTATISFYSTYNDVAYELNVLPDNFENTQPYSQEIYVEVKDIFRERIDVITLNVVEKPVVLPDDETIYCFNNYPNTITLNAGLQNPSTVKSETYQWFKNHDAIFENTATIEINEAGLYRVIVSNASNCSVERVIEVIESEKAMVEEVLVVENTVSVIVSGKGDYEYAIDDGFGTYQKSNTFENVSAGNHTIYIQDLNGCEITMAEVSVSGFPKFFTPNNDGFNDIWKPLGLDENSSIKISIYNRFGKFLVHISESGWDGTYNGQPMPSGDYWYHVTLDNGDIIKGHFTLKR